MKLAERSGCDATGCRRSVVWLPATLGLVSLGIGLAVLPAVLGATVCADDFVWIQIAHRSESLFGSLIEAWPDQLFFRPIDVAANWLVDPRTLVLAPLIVVQMIGLAAVSAGVIALIGRCGSRSSVALIAALAWLWMHPSTHLAVWSAGCSSQTWCAAAGVWGLWVLLKSRSQHPAAVWKLAALSAFGVVAKELFVGWATGLALLVLAMPRDANAPPPRRGATRQSLLLMLAILLPPALWLVARWLSSSLHDVTSRDAAGLYAIHGPVTVVRNAAIAGLGMFAQGPVHWARLRPMPWSAVPFIGASISFGLVWSGAQRMRSLAAIPLARYALAGCIGLGLLAVWPALVIEHVSELYLFGPNALVAVLVGLGVEEVCRKARGWKKGCMQIGVVVLFVIAAVGLVSRTRLFFTTWSYARHLRQETSRAVAAAGHPENATVLIPAELFAGPMHSKYCVPPAVAAALPQAWATMRLGDPSLPAVTFADGRSPPVEPPASVILLEADLPPRTIW
jgi:hypothetical protein